MSYFSSPKNGALAVEVLPSNYSESMFHWDLQQVWTHVAPEEANLEGVCPCMVPYNSRRMKDQSIKSLTQMWESNNRKKENVKNQNQRSKSMHIP
jgi:hypothetical protein